MIGNVMVTERAAADPFRAMGDPTRREILLALLEKGPSPVHEIAGRFDCTRPAISRHLRILKEAGLVETERRGRWTVYRPCPERVAMVAESLRAVGSTHKLPGGPSLSAA